MFRHSNYILFAFPYCINGMTFLIRIETIYDYDAISALLGIDLHVMQNAGV